MASVSFSTICNMLFKPNRSKILYTFGFKPYITKSTLLALKSSIWAIKTPAKLIAGAKPKRYGSRGVVFIACILIVIYDNCRI